MKVKVGDRAPDFALPDQSGRDVSLKDFLGKRSIVLYFYPKDFTLGCTAEARSFSERYEEFKELGADVIGVSSDTVESHGSFASECNAPFTLLSDEGGRVRRLYGVESSLGLIPGRVTYVIDRSGFVRHIYASQLNPKKHVKEAMETLRTMATN
jgi:peroxiredoxin Q/BCP